MADPDPLKAHPAEASDAPAAQAWLWTLLLMFGYAISVMDRVGVGLLAAPIQRDLHLSYTQLGLIQGAAFGFFYIGLALPLGRLVDRWDRRWILIGGILVWSVATLLSGLAGTAAGLFLARLFVGAGEATLSPASASLIADLFSPRRRPLAYGVFTVGVGLGIGTAFLGTGLIVTQAPAINQALAWTGIHLADWRQALVALALPGLALALALLVFVREPARRAAPTGDTARIGEVFGFMAPAPAPFAALIIGAALLQFAGTILISWFPTILLRDHGLSAGQVGGLLGPIAVLIGIPSALLGGALIGWLSRFSPARAPFIVLTVGMVCYPAACAFAMMAPRADAAIAGYAFSSIFANWSAPAALSGLVLLTPPRLRGRMAAVQAMVIGVISLGVGPALTGYLADRVFPQASGLAVAATLLIMGGAALGLVLLGLGYRKLPKALARADL